MGFSLIYYFGPFLQAQAHNLIIFVFWEKTVIRRRVSFILHKRLMEPRLTFFRNNVF
jgi:hypothetical protein